MEKERRKELWHWVAVTIGVLLLMRGVLKVHYSNLPIMLSYLLFLGGLIVLLNLLLQKRMEEKLVVYARSTQFNPHLVSLLASIINFILILYASFLIKFIDNVWLGDNSFEYFKSKGGWKSVLNFSFILTALTYFLYYTRFSAFEKKILLKGERVKTENVSAQFESLKNQLDPHFLFNSLNVLNALIEENPDRAQEFTNSLSTIYRYILEQKDKQLVPLEQELKFATNYIKLLQVRFEDALTFEIPSEVKQQGAKIIPLALQLLLENVIKHNKISSIQPIHIRIEETSNNYLIVL